VLFAVHASVLVLSLACVWAAITFTTDSVVVEEGGSFLVGGAEWRLEKVEVLYYPDGSVSDWVSTVATPEGRQEIRVNHPAGGGAEKVLQSAYSRIYRARLEAAGTVREIELEQDTEFPLAADGSVGFALSPPQAGSLAAGREAGMPGMVDLLLTARGRIVQRAAMFEGLPLDIGETGLRLTVTGSRARSGFLVRHTPGLPFVWAGFALLGLSVTALMLLPRRPAQLAHKEKADA
jgi:cytochrome c biogenesis protein